MTAKTEMQRPHRKFAMSFDAMSMPTLIRAGYGLLIALILLLLAGSYGALSQIGTKLEGFKDMSAHSTTMGSVAEDVFEARLAAYNYRVTGDPSAREAVRSNIEEVLSHPDLAAALIEAGQNRASYQGMEAAAEGYLADFDQLVVQTQNLDAVATELRELRDGVSETLETMRGQAFASGDGSLAQTISSVLRQVKLGEYETSRFIAAGDPAIFDAAAAHFDQAHGEMLPLLSGPANGEPRRSAQIVVDLIDGMKERLPDVQAIHAAREELAQTGLMQNGLALQDSVEAVLDDLLAEQAETGQNAVDASELTQGASLMAGVVLAIVAAGVAFAVSRLVAGRIRGLADTTDNLVNGQLDIEIPGQARSDETGRLARALVVFRDSRKEAALREERDAQAQKDRQAVVSALSAGLSRMSDGDLDVRMTEELAPDFESLRHDFNATAKQLSTAFSDIIEQTENIRSGAANLTAASDDLARRTEGQAAALEETAATIVQLSQSVTDTASGTDKANDFVKTTRNSAENSLSVVSSTLESIKKIQATSHEVSQIIGVIDDIAFQTNLLALNAGVEAARAGAAGQGFAVVASEVRALAQRSSTAAKEIKQLIETSVSQVNEGVVKADETGEALTKIVSMVGQISDQMANISAETLSQSEGLKEINAAVSHLDTVTQQNAAMVEETTAASHELTHNARSLTRITGAFQVGKTADDLTFETSAEAVLDEKWIAAQHAG